MRNIRLIARLDIKGPNLIKGIHLEGLRIIGSPNEHALRYYNEGIDLFTFIQFFQDITHFQILSFIDLAPAFHDSF